MTFPMHKAKLAALEEKSLLHNFTLMDLDTPVKNLPEAVTARGFNNLAR